GRGLARRGRGGRGRGGGADGATGDDPHPRPQRFGGRGGGHAGQRRHRAVRRSRSRSRHWRPADQCLRLAQRIPGQRPGRAARAGRRAGGTAGPAPRGGGPWGPAGRFRAGPPRGGARARAPPRARRARGRLSPGSAPAWAGGLVLVACYVLRERRAGRERTVGRERRAPAAVNLSLLRSPARALTLGLACVASVVLFAVLFLAPLFLQQIQHHGTTVTGLVLLPQGVVMGLASWLGSVLIERGKAHPAVITVSVSGGLALLAASTMGLLLLTASTPLWVTTALLCGRGVALGLTVQPLVMALLAGLGPRLMPDANTLFNM